MRLFTRRWLIMPAVAAIAASGAQAQVPAPYEIEPPGIAVSGPSGPYEALPSGPVKGQRLLPATEVYTVLRENGFSPLGGPQQRGFVYTVAVIDPDGDDGRLLFDARDGRILRFMPAAWRRDNRDDLPATYGPVGPPPRIIEARGGPPRPPASIPQRYASRSPLPVPMPSRLGPHAVVPSKHLAARPKPAAPPAQRSAAMRAKPAESKPAVAAPAPVEAKPPVIEPTQTMPAVQGLD